MVDAVRVVRRDNLVALLGYPIFDESILKRMQIRRNPDILNDITPNQQVVRATASLEDTHGNLQKQSKKPRVLYNRPDFYAPDCTDFGRDKRLGLLEPVVADFGVAVHEHEPFGLDSLDADLSCFASPSFILDEQNVVMLFLKFIHDFERSVCGVGVDDY